VPVTVVCTKINLGWRGLRGTGDSFLGVKTAGT